MSQNGFEMAARQVLVAELASSGFVILEYRNDLGGDNRANLPVTGLCDQPATQILLGLRAFCVPSGCNRHSACHHLNTGLLCFLPWVVQLSLQLHWLWKTILPFCAYHVSTEMALSS